MTEFPWVKLAATALIAFVVVLIAAVETRRRPPGARPGTPEHRWWERIFERIFG